MEEMFEKVDLKKAQTAPNVVQKMFFDIPLGKVVSYPKFQSGIRIYN